MINLKKRELYRLGELIITISNAIIKNGIDKLLDYNDMDFCIYTEGYIEYASVDSVCYLDDYPDINDEGEEEYPDFVIRQELELFYSGEQFEDVIGNILHQKSNASINEFIAGLNHYREYDDFLEL